jgi:hypothetical protein
MPTTYEPIATTTLGSDQSTVTFSSIPSTYTDLVVSANFGGFSVSFDNIWAINFNGSTANNYSQTILYGDGVDDGSARRTTANADGMIIFWRADNNSLTSTGLINIFNYANTTTYKTVLARSGSKDLWTSANAGLWQSTTAITSLSFKWLDTNQKYRTGSTFTLYGIKAA